MKKLVAIRLDDESIQKLEELQEMTGWTQTEILRRLIDYSWVRPAAIGIEMPVKKVEPLVRAMAL